MRGKESQARRGQRFSEVTSGAKHVLKYSIMRTSCAGVLRMDVDLYWVIHVLSRDVLVAR